MGRKVLKIAIIVLCAVVALALALVIFLTPTEYRPNNVETLAPYSYGDATKPGSSISLLSWNIGYCGLGQYEDFVMDGGTGSDKPGRERFEEYYDGVLDTLSERDADIYLIQEADSDSARSYRADEVRGISETLGVATSVYALNYYCPFVPFPWPPMGRINSGIMTMSDFEIEGAAKRISLPCPFSWPLRTANLKRCLLVTHYALPGTDEQLAVVNLHLEAYDDGEGKAAQTEMLLEVLESEYAAGNYVIAGGDFNQTFPGTLERWPMLNAEFWTPGVLTDDMLPEGWSFVYDDTSPTCRLNNAPYNAETSQHYVLDGFIVSPNITVESVQTIPTGFKYSDHSPVALEVSLSEE
ncbi:MAG TPA: endonuclease [Candidatus Scatomorpha merdigallinarum]|nr:endonuclease [Candidatus Scatomorpha merdigallinarum]